MSKENLYNRRKFLQSLTHYLGTSVFLSSLPWFSVLADEAGNSTEKIRLGIIGTGSRGKYLMLHLLNIPSVEIIALCDNFNPHLKEAMELTNHKAKPFKDYRKLLEINNLDAVVIATPLHLHAQMTIDALESGKHVFCEKSMARTIEDCKKMVLTQQKTGRNLQIGHQRMFCIKYIRGIEQIKDGRIGKVTQIKAYWHRNNDWRRPLPGPGLERHINWRLYDEYSAGLMTELATHQIQIANWILDDIPETVMGSGSINFWRDGREVFDNVNVIYKYPGGIHLIYDSVISNKFYGLEEQIMGNKGTYEMEKGKFYAEKPPAAPGILQLINNLEHQIFDNIPIGGPSWVPETALERKGEYITDIHPLPNSTMLQMEAFVSSVRNNKPIPGMVEQSYQASVASLLGYNAVKENRIVHWPDEYKLFSKKT